jgi:DNA-binding transcriptional regulator YhcF (GntR family)
MEGWGRDRATVANVASHPGGEGENMPRGRVESKARDEIFRLIVERELAPGTRITEVFLAEKLGISRTPVRIALRELIAEGLLERDSTRGCIIPPLESEDMRHVFSLREKLEGMAAVQAAEHASPEDVKSLERILEEGAEDYTGWRREAFARHTGIYRPSSHERQCLSRNTSENASGGPRSTCFSSIPFSSSVPKREPWRPRPTMERPLRNTGKFSRPSGNVAARMRGWPWNGM